MKQAKNKKIEIMYKNKIISIGVSDLFRPIVIISFVIIVFKKVPSYLSRNLKNIKQKNINISFYNTHRDDVDNLLSIVCDDLSREVINGQINFSKTFDSFYIKNIFRPSRQTYIENNTVLDRDHYFSKDIIKLSNREGFVNCGSYNGDTIREFIHQVNGDFNHIFAFEPSPLNFIALNKTVEELKISLKTTCYQKGVYSSDTTCNFNVNVGDSGGSSIAKGGDNIIEVVALDLFLNNDEKAMITFINMDIEGAEIDALMGMKEIIKKNKPKLAISVYHKPEHFWEIPMLIKQLNPDYKIYFRQHALSQAETVCYAV